MQSASTIAVESGAVEAGGGLARIRELDGLRGVAALAVFCHHVLFTTVARLEAWPLPVRLIGHVCQAGAYGVDLFFVLSGFLITSILLADREQPHFYWNFYWRRALRILPVYVLMLVALAWFYPFTRGYVLLSALFLANFERVFGLGAYAPFWTLAIEEQFYLFWPRAVRRLRVEGVRRLAWGIALGCLGCRLLDALGGHHNYRFTFFHCDGLAIGAVLACQLSVLPAVALRGVGWAQRELRLMLSVGAVGVVLAALPGVRPGAGRLAIFAGAFTLTGVSLIAYCAVRAAVVFRGAGFLWLLRTRLLRFYGLVSYALYLFHEYILGHYPLFFGRLAVGNVRGYSVRFAVILGVTTVIAVVSRYLIERPAMSLRRYVLRKG